MNSVESQPKVFPIVNIVKAEVLILENGSSPFPAPCTSSFGGNRRYQIVLASCGSLKPASRRTHARQADGQLPARVSLFRHTQLQRKGTGLWQVRSGERIPLRPGAASGMTSCTPQTLLGWSRVGAVRRFVPRSLAGFLRADLSPPHSGTAGATDCWSALPRRPARYRRDDGSSNAVGSQALGWTVRAACFGA
jgi:hypothetical protein